MHRSGALALLPRERVGLWGSLFHSIFSTTAPDYDRSQWLREKFKLGLDFPNVGAGDGGALRK